MSLDALQARLAPCRAQLLNHPIYRDLTSRAALRTFMEHHVFAVWDFMSLLKALQQQLCCVTVPWLPTTTHLGARLINSIVLAEETDDDGQRGFASHFELYHRSMLRYGADTAPIDRFLAQIGRGTPVAAALQSDVIPAAIRDFVGHTFAVIARGDLCEIAAAFTFGREDLLPGVFQRIVDELARQADGGLDEFKYYLVRHIELDGDEHGPMADRLVQSLCGDHRQRWQTATDAAVAALEARYRLWNAIHAAVQSTATTAG